MPLAVQDKKALMRLLTTHQNDIKAFGVSRLGIFGSFARGNDLHPDSDVDFFVEFETGKKTFDNFMDLSFYLEELTGRRVELVTPQSLNNRIGPAIINQVENVIG